MKNQRYLGKGALILISLALLIVSLWEICVRLDAMYAPLNMFFSMAVGEGIGLTTAMSYFDYSVFEAPLWLAGCILLSILSFALSSRPKGGYFLLPASLGMALYGLTRQTSFMTDFWRLIQPALLLAICVLSALNLFILPLRRKRRRSKNDPFSDSPRLTDAPRLKRTRSSPDRRAG